MKSTRSKVWLVVSVLALAGCSSEESAPSAGTEGGSAAAEAEVVESHPGEAIYEQFCFSCHTPGLSGSPKLGDVEAWAPRIAKGADLLLKTTIEGIPPAMPVRGLCMSCTDEELAQAIDFMVVSSQ